MNKKSAKSPRNPLIAALAEVDAAIHAQAPPAERAAAALAILADQLARMLSDSDASARFVDGVAGSRQTRKRHDRMQDGRVADIRTVSREASRSRRDQLPALYRRARASTRSALRSQVKKIRAGRRSRQEEPGGEG